MTAAPPERKSIPVHHSPRSPNPFNPALPLQEPNLLCQLLQALEGEVAFAAFDTAHVGAVDTKDFCEGFLAQASLQPVGAQVPAHRLLRSMPCASARDSLRA